jgi:hypothetical protein
MPPVIVVGAIAVPLGLALSAYNARLYRNRQRRLDAILAALSAAGADLTASELAVELNLGAFKFGGVYVDLDLLERRGRVSHRWDAEAGRMFWSIRGGMR